MTLFNNYIEQIESSDNTILYNFYNGVSIKYPHSLFKNIKEFSNNREIYDLLSSEQFYLIIFALKLLIEPFNLSSLSMKIVIFAVLIVMKNLKRVQ